MSIHTVQKSRKAQGACHVCREPIPEGSAYNWSQASRFAPKIKWHAGCPQPRPSALEGNDKRARVMAATEEAHDRLDEIAEGEPAETTADDIIAVLNDCAEAIREVASEYEEAAEAMGAAGEENTERAGTLNEAADNIEAADIEERPEADEDEDEDEDGDEAPDLAEWLEAQIDTARSAINDIEIP